MNKMKQFFSIFIIAVMLLSGVFGGTMTADAADEELKTYYAEDVNISDYWTNKTAPVKEGYLFGGWYVKDGETYTALEEENLSEEELSALSNVCAKFVPAYVMSVKAQIEASTQTGDGATESTYIRFLTGLDSNAYQKVNFEIYYNNKIEATGLPDVNKVFRSIKNDDGEISPETIFGSEAHYIGALRINKILDDHYSKIIYVRPSWTTLDGTTVSGQGKYIRVEDGFVKNAYISVPINLLGGENVAAGQLQMTYDASTLQIVNVDTGRLMPEMEYNTGTAGVIKFVGNTESGNVTANGLFANVRFQKISQDELAEDVEYPSFWDFVVGEDKFCDWDTETIIETKVWDARY